jgi:hypothetical protein
VGIEEEKEEAIMPSPFGRPRAADIYYQHGGFPRHYVYNWTGTPMPAARAGETSELSGDYIDISAQYHKELSDYPVAMTMRSGQLSVLHSGPEQLGAAQLSRNEKRLLGAAALAGAAYLAWLKWGKKK